MRNIAVGIVVAASFYAAPAMAQATRTWVSGVGDDVNPCSRTAPCKTFAGAISKTATGGEIDCLDPAGFGTLTITKSITIDCTGTFGSTLNSGGINGFVINDSATVTPGTARVVLRGISINGAGTTPGLNGIRFISGASLVVEHVIIQNNLSTNGQGISFQPVAAARLALRDVLLVNNGTSSTGGGILVQPTGASGSAIVTLENVSLKNNLNGGFKIDTTGNTSAAGVKATIGNSDISANGGGVAVAVPAGTSTVSLMIMDSNVSNNGAGIIANGGAATIRVSRTTITNNGSALVQAAGGTIASFGNNLLQGNTVNGAFTGAVLPTN
ncbi:hypothetical protein PIB19_22630 [Sphingomonas sp. 7/4-4]|uniref:hypothetical protein n=1 Tax=Sphingomonas sp. 7/4-4 TaxID=3018446 RepID=UPI0022F3EFE0|nr:hypothetical protein [Sphingomonas sp. 7/4-4]WBY07993.1 hypothetical protein PIB19_22630 [Sphingomonas sp. 7/4-4]